MSEFRIGIGIELPPRAPLDAKTFPNLAYAVQMIAERGAEIWRGYASGKPLPDGKIIHARTGQYMRSITMRSLGDFAAEDYTDLSYAEALEKGTGPRDMKKMLNTSLKVRISKKGKRYLIIPFRHGTPGSVGFRSVMPEPVHMMWRGMRASRVTGTFQEANHLGVHNLRTRAPMMVTRRKYKWGDRMSAAQLRAAGVRGRQLRHMTGMVHMQEPTTHGHGQYLTFRVMSEDSKGWVTQGMPAFHPAKVTAEQLKPAAEKAFAEAVSRDVKRYLGAQ
ncbi:MAG TPA: hypothetical protein VFM97_00095 [Gammaproteobacteria bacterium]|nr:hypothetical protein [Gammaproteobacteria bacterium]